MIKIIKNHHSRVETFGWWFNYMKHLPCFSYTTGELRFIFLPFRQKNSHPIGWLLCLCRHRPIFPSGFPLSIFGAVELNYRVRDGNGWTLNAINTDYMINRYTAYTFFKMVTRTRFELVLPA